MDIEQINNITAPNENGPFTGTMKISVVSSEGFEPIAGARIKIWKSSTPNVILFDITTDNSGQTQVLTLPAPDPQLSQQPEDVTPPYEDYDISVEANGYDMVTVEGSELLPNELSLQQVTLKKKKPEVPEQIIIIPPHTLFAEYPPKIPESEIKPLPENGEIVLSRVVIPEYIIVHDGVPSDNTAKNYWVKYKDYIKNVASSEIYATWPESTIYANILVIQSFTLNRVFTEYYRSRGYDFTITSSTAYDQKWIYGRNTYSNIDYLVDSIFANYLSRPGVKQPIFTSYCDGQRVQCNGLSQWGSKFMGDEGYSAIQIIRNYYGNDMYINTAQAISGVPSSFPGYNLNLGSSGEKVRQLQTQLNRIARNYPAIPTIVADGIYGPKTKAAVEKFQSIFNLPVTGVTDYPTWYAISNIYVAVSRISEPGT